MDTHSTQTLIDSARSAYQEALRDPDACNRCFMDVDPQYGNVIVVGLEDGPTAISLCEDCHADALTVLRLCGFVGP